MDKTVFVDQLFEEGKKAGFEDMEVYISGNNEFEVTVFKGDINNYSVSEEQGLSFRGLYKGKMGYSYTEKMDESSINMLIHEAKENSQIIESDDNERIFKGSKEYKEVITYNHECENVPAEEKIDFVKKMEAEGLQLDERVDTINYSLISDGKNSTTIMNTQGLQLEHRSNLYIAYVSAVIKSGEDVKNGSKFVVTNDFRNLDSKELAKEAVDEGLSMLGASSIKSGDYTVILKSSVSANILKSFGVIFSADNVHKNLSLLKGKIGEAIAEPSVTIVDDPFMKDGVYTRAFDAEGVASCYKKLVDKGILTTYLHNLKTAEKDGIESTGNAFKGSYKAPIDIAPSNMYIEKGDISYGAMIEGTRHGILIIDVQGLHSGLNTISGDFSLSAHGYEIVDGKIHRPVNQITISGNYLDMLKNIEQIGDDLEFSLPGYGYIGSPSLKIKSLSVAGE